MVGWRSGGGEPGAAPPPPPMELHLETFRRILAERVADAAGILEDGSVSKGENPVTYTDETGESRPVPNLIGDFVDFLLLAMRIETPDDLAPFLAAFAGQGFARFHLAFR